MEEEIDHEYTTNAVCPYCGEENEDSWELEGDNGTVACGRCGKDFIYDRIITIEYSTEKMPSDPT